MSIAMNNSNNGNNNSSGNDKYAMSAIAAAAAAAAKASANSSSSSSSSTIPMDVIAQHVAPFLDRTTFNNLAYTSKSAYYYVLTSSRVRILLSKSKTSSSSSGTDGIIIPPWPSKLKSRDHMTRIRRIVFSDDGTNLACGCSDGMIRTWNVWTGERRRPLQDWPGQAVVALAFSTDGSKLASASTGHTIKIWSLDNWKNDGIKATTILPLPKNIHAGHVSCLAFSYDGTKLYSGHHHRGEVLQVWDSNSGRRLLELRGGTNDPVTCIRPCRNDHYVVATCGTKCLKVWELSTGRCCQRWGNGKSYNAIRIQHRQQDQEDFDRDNNMRKNRGATDVPLSLSIQIASIESQEGFNVWTASLGRTTSTNSSNSGTTLQARPRSNSQSSHQHPAIMRFGNLCPYEIRLSSNGNKVASVDDFKSVKVWNTTASTTTTAPARAPRCIGDKKSSSSSSSDSALSSYFEEEGLFPIHDLAFAADHTLAVVSRYYNAIHLFPA